MSDRLPPLTALKAFDAAARHASFSKAAAELNVTPGALSLQIRTLEEHLGKLLFRRLNRTVELTEAGRTLAPGIEDAFQTMKASWRATRRLNDMKTLNVTAGPAFTAKWMAPRLFQFAQMHPEIDLRFFATLRLLDIQRDEIDVAIRFGYGIGEDIFSVPLAFEWVTPVMIPSLVDQFPTPESLSNATLIFDQSLDFLSPSCDWSAWFQAVGVDIKPEQGPRFSQADHALDAALAGVGVALGRRALVVKDIDEGRLVAPYGIALKIEAQFRFICATGAENRPHIKAFLEWILSEVDKLKHVSDHLKIIRA